MSEVHFRLYLSPVLCANDRPPKTFLASHSNPLRHAVIHHHAWLTSQLKFSSKYQAPVSSCYLSRSLSPFQVPTQTHTDRHYVSTWQGDLVTSPVPGGVGLRVPVATSRLELPPDLLKYRKTGTNHSLENDTWFLLISFLFSTLNKEEDTNCYIWWCECKH